MNENFKGPNDGDGAAGAGSLFEGFDAIEALQEASQSVGWHCEYRQMEAGPFRSRVGVSEAGRILVIREAASRHLEVVAGAPADMYTVFVPLPGCRVRMNGHEYIGRNTVLVKPGAELYAATRAGTDSLSMHIPAAMLGAHVEAHLPELYGPNAVQVVPVAATSRTIEALRRLMLDTFQSADGDPADIESELVDATAVLLERASGLPPDRYHRLRKRRALYRSLDYIDSHLDRPIRMADLCRHAGVSLSTLERLFKRELQMTPGNYIRSRRLAAVRRKLVGKAPSTSIEEIARSTGFRHMGRFAAAYRDLFGCLPSDELHGR